MVRKLLSFIHREVGGLHEAAFLLGFSSLFSQILALLRDRLLAASFGTGTALDVYYAAFRIPDILFISVGSFVSITILIPFIITKFSAGEQEEARGFLSRIFSLFCVVMIVASVILYFLIPQLVPLVIPGFKGEALEQLIHATRLMLWSPFLLGLSTLFGSITQASKKFFVLALCPIFYNLGIIIGIVLLYPLFGFDGLIYGVILGACLHLLIQVPSVIKTGLVPVFSKDLWSQEIRQVILISIPRTITLAADKIALLVLVAFASSMAAGSIAIFNLALNLQSVPLSLVGVSYSVAAFPALAELWNRADRAAFIAKVALAIRHVIFWSLPATALFIVLRAQIVRVVLGAGKFNWSDTRLTAAALAIFTLSVVAQSLNLLFVRAYYAAGRTRKPLFINASFSIFTIIAATVLMRLFATDQGFHAVFGNLLRVGDISRSPILMLVLAYSASALLNVLVLWFCFYRDFGSFPRVVYTSAWQAFIISIIGGFATYVGLGIFVLFGSITTFAGIFLQGLFAGILGIVVMGLLLYGFQNPEFLDVLGVIQRRFWRTKALVVPPVDQPDQLAP